MVSGASSWLARSRAFRTLLSDAQLAVRLLREPAVPAWVKAVPFAALAYVLSPFDLLPDVLPVIGQLDDLGVMILGLKVFLGLCPSGAVAFHRTEIAHRRPFTPMSEAADIIEADFRRE